MFGGGKDLVIGDAYDEPWIKELVGADPEKRNWKGIIIAILVILLVFALILVAVILVSPEQVRASKDKTLGDPFTFDDIFNSEFAPKTFDARWIDDQDAFVYRSREGEILLYNITNRSTTLIMDNSTFRFYDTETYFVSPDLQYVLIAMKTEKVFKYSYSAEYKIFNRHAVDPAARLIDFPMDSDGNWEEKKLQFAGWSSTGHRLIFVYGNDLYYQKDPISEYTRITESGSNLLYNGIPNWLYEEEIFHSRVSHWWSEKSTYICYAQINDTNVPLYTIPWYEDSSNLYGSSIDIAYPKAGDVKKNINPTIKLMMIKTDDLSASQQEIQPPSQYAQQEYYVTSVHWQSDTSLLVTWTNRPQNHSIITLCTAPFTNCVESIDKKSNGGWVTTESIVSIDEGSSYLTLLPAREGDSGYWKHIAMVKTSSNGVKTFITQGAFDVIDILGYRQSTQTVFYLGTNGDPRKRHIYSVYIPSINEKMQKPKCISCEMGDSCQYTTGTFSSSGDYYILQCQGPGVPQYILRSTLDDSFNNLLEDNNMLAAKLNKTALPVVDTFSIASEDGREIWIKMFLPPLLNKEHITLYPLLINTFAAPGSQLVTYEFKLDWGTYLSSTHNIIYAHVDGHGSANQGEKWLFSLYKHLGTIEVEDQIRAAQHMKKYDYVDDERIGIWGSGYGGFVTAHVLGDDHSDIFNCGVSVSPITDFRYYDTAFTERYLGLHSNMENLPGYEATNVSAKASNFAAHEYLLVHSAADKNVHYQNTAQLAKALTESEVDFHMQVYTDGANSPSEQQHSRHLYKTMTHFIRDTCWNGANPREYRKGKYVDVDLQLLAIR